MTVMVSLPGSPCRSPDRSSSSPQPGHSITLTGSNPTVGAAPYPPKWNCEAGRSIWHSVESARESSIVFTDALPSASSAADISLRRVPATSLMPGASSDWIWNRNRRYSLNQLCLCRLKEMIPS